MAIKLSFIQTTDNLFGRSKIWGCPDLPDTMDYPESEYEEDGVICSNPLTFICQIRCEEIAKSDKEGLLPHTGMLYFFAEVDYFLGDHDYSYSGMGEWPKDSFRVLYAPNCENLHTHRLVDEDGRDMGLPAEAIRFSVCGDREDGFKLLGHPYFDEVEVQYPDLLSLMQLDCHDEWNLQFYDCGMLNFLLKEDSIKSLQFADTICYLHSC